MIFIQYRGKISDDFEKSLKRINSPVKVIFTLRKLKNILPSLKPKVEKSYKSAVVYQISCPRCMACYVGQTSRHLQTRLKEHRYGPVGGHMKTGNQIFNFDDVRILATAKNRNYLLIYEALFIRDLKPILNTKDEYRSKTLVIKI